MLKNPQRHRLKTLKSERCPIHGYNENVIHFKRKRRSDWCL